MYPDDELDELEEQDAPIYGRAPRLVVWMVGLGLLGLVAFLALQSAPEESLAGAVPDFDLPLLSGEGSVTMEQLQGKPVVLNFWASWCGPCREEAPLIEEVWKDYQDEGVVILGIATQDTEEEARAFVKETGLTYPMVRDPGSDLFDQLRLLGLPQTLFVTRDGFFLDPPLTTRSGAEGVGVTVLGAISEEQLRSGIEALLGQASQ